MILYVNGDSHTAAAEAVNQHAFAEDDPNYQHLKLRPHPDNLAVSWGKKLSTLVNASEFICDAESASSNDRIIRTTKEWIDANVSKHNDVLIVIGWSTWERVEWLIDGTYYQLNSSGAHCVPLEYSKKYKDYIASIDTHHKNNIWHNRIWDLHTQLADLNIPHLFFNSNHHLEVNSEKQWGVNYISPYEHYKTYDAYLKLKGQRFGSGFHYDAHAHTKWAHYLFKHIKENNIV